MDSLASIGRFWATPQFYGSLIIGAIFIGFGIYIIVTQKQETIPGVPETKNEPPSILGTVLIIYGIGIPILGWIRRRFIRSNPGIAAVAGVMDISAFFK